jgi:hypothetical protein
MATTVLITALPITLAAGAQAHLSAFVTHKLVAEPPAGDAPTLADFPAVADWVTTLAASTLTLTTSLDPVRAIPLSVVSAPSAGAWTACLPSATPVQAFPTPTYTDEDWRSLPASRLSDHAIDVHLAAATAAPTTRSGVHSDPVAESVFGAIAQLGAGPTLQRLRDARESKAGRDAEILRRRTAAATTTIGPLTDALSRDELRTGPRLPPYQSETGDIASAIEILLDDPDADTRLTEQLDQLVAADPADPQLRILADAHATRRYYERPDEPQQDPKRLPPENPPAKPRPPVPQHDFHQRVAGFGAMPALLRALGLAIDLIIDDPDPAALLAGATWVSISLTAPDDLGLTVPEPRRTAVVVNGDEFRAASSPDWIGGALPLADDAWRVLDLDPDASGLKLDQHLRSLVRRLAAEVNGDPVTAAPATLRSNGFAIARVNRADATRGRVAAAEQLAGDVGRELLFDDLVRGIRVEVWDDVTGDWHSLHRRLLTVDGVAGEPVLQGAEDIGFLQLSALNHNPAVPDGALYIHEVVAGWDGWSLSAPRPGKVIVHVEPPGPDGSTEAVVDRGEEATGDATAGSIRTRIEVAPSSLPRLRYGTSYSFRILGVDLAGNTVPQQIVDAEPTPEAVAAAEVHLDGLRRAYARRDSASLSERLRSQLLQQLAAPATPADTVRLPGEMSTGDAAVDEQLRISLAQAVAHSSSGESAPTQHPIDTVAQAVRALAAGRPLRVRPQLGTEAHTLAQLVARAGVGAEAEAVALRTVTAPRPYLRWDPVPFPALVPRFEYSTGEQLSRLVVRSGLPDDGGSDVRPTSERHLAPPKATQLEAETAGRFDAAIGTGDAAEVARLYRLALVEEGTFLDQRAPNPDDPDTPLDQPGVALVSRPGADPEHAKAFDSADEDKKYHRGDELGEGQYVIHNTNEVRLPYLPDPYATGATMVFIEAGVPHRLPQPRVLQSVTVPYPDAWPDLKPLRLILDRADNPSVRLGARVDGREVHVTVPVGESVRVWLSSSLNRNDLNRFGLWRTQNASIQQPGPDGLLTQDQVVAAETLMRAAAEGWTWWLTPSTDLTLVHAVPRPVTPPLLSGLRILARPVGRGVVALTGVVHLHGPSTEHLYLRATWSETLDDPATPGPEVVERSDVVVNSPVGDRERSGVLGMVDFLPQTGGVDLADGTLGLHAAIQKFPDTHHRVITYTPSGTTRYRELFSPQDVPPDDDPSLAGEPVTLDIPSSSRPSGVKVLDTVPLLRWERFVEPADAFALRSVRRSGVRVWLDRPWFSSGDGELFGVLTFDPFSRTGPGLKPVQVRDGSTSLWGKDPINAAGGETGGLASATNPPLITPLQLMLSTVGAGLTDLDLGPARPVRITDDIALVDHPVNGDQPSLVRVFGYRPQYDAGTRRWFADIALDDGPSLWPFVRLAVARYQPNSLPLKELSPVTLTAWVQPLPTRTLTVSRQAPDRVQVTLSGTISFLHDVDLTTYGPGENIPGFELTGDSPTGPAAGLAAKVRRSRRVRVTLQRLPPGAGDLGWVDTFARREIRAVSVDCPPNTAEASASWKATWTGPMDLPPGSGTPAGDALGLPPMQTPGSSSEWRILVEEHEILDADDRSEPTASAVPVQVERLVYADTVPL